MPFCYVNWQYRFCTLNPFVNFTKTKNINSASIYKENQTRPHYVSLPLSLHSTYPSITQPSFSIHSSRLLLIRVRSNLTWTLFPAIVQLPSFLLNSKDWVRCQHTCTTSGRVQRVLMVCSSSGMLTMSMQGDVSVSHGSFWILRHGKGVWRSMNSMSLNSRHAMVAYLNGTDRGVCLPP